MTEQMQFSKPYPAAYLKALDAILALPSGPARWRVIAAVWVNTNHTQDDGLRAKEAYLQAVREVNEKRDHLHTEFAELKSTDTARDSGMREALEIPAGLWGWLKMFDMDSFATPALTKKNMKRLREEFPEFTVAAKY